MLTKKVNRLLSAFAVGVLTFGMLQSFQIAPASAAEPVVSEDRAGVISGVHGGGVVVSPTKVSGGHFVRIRAGAPNSTVMGNLTVTGPENRGFTTAYPCLEERPNASVNNYVANQTTPNFAVVKTDANGDICIYTTTNAHLIWDQVVETN